MRQEQARSRRLWRQRENHKLGQRKLGHEDGLSEGHAFKSRPCQPASAGPLSQRHRGGVDAEAEATGFHQGFVVSNDPMVQFKTCTSVHLCFSAGVLRMRRVGYLLTADHNIV